MFITLRGFAMTMLYFMFCSFASPEPEPSRPKTKHLILYRTRDAGVRVPGHTLLESSQGQRGRSGWTPRSPEQSFAERQSMPYLWAPGPAQPHGMTG